MIHGPLLGKMIAFTIPVILSGVLQLLFNAADIIVVGRFAGNESLAAVGSTSSLINLLVNLFMGLSVGANVTVAFYFGCDHREKVRDTIHTSITLSLVCGVFLSIFGMLTSHQLLVWMGSPDDVISLATTYLQIYFLGMPALLTYNFGEMCIRDRVKVIAGAGDNAAAAVGTGTVGDGACNISLGTSGTIFISSDQFGVDEKNALHSFAHANGKYHLMGCMLSAASCNKWWMDEILQEKDYVAAQKDI